MASYQRKYATGTGADIYINIPKAGSANHAISADWSPAAGDVKISKDGAAAGNIGTLPTAIAMGNSTIWKFVFTDSELTCAFLSVTVSDSATKAVDDTGFSIETYGNASALHAFDLDTALQSVSVTQWLGQAVAAVTVNGVPEVDVTHFNGAAGTFASGIPEVKVASLAAGSITAGVIADAAIDAATFAADVDAEILSYVIDDATRIDASALNTASVTTIPAILTDTAEIGAAGAGLSAVPWNASWDAEVESEATDALVAQNLDHLVKIAVDTNFATTVHADSVVGQIADNGAGFDRTTDSLEVLRDSLATATALATAQTSIDDLPTNAELSTALGTADDAVLTAINDLPTNAELATALGTADDAVLSAIAAVDTKIDTIDNFLDTEIADILTDTGTTLDDFIDGEVAAIKAKTDQLTFTVAAKVDANVQTVNDVDLLGDGSATPWGPV